jgi:hypothetical protein
LCEGEREGEGRGRGSERKIEGGRGKVGPSAGRSHCWWRESSLPRSAHTRREWKTGRCSGVSSFLFFDMATNEVELERKNER